MAGLPVPVPSELFAPRKSPRTIEKLFNGVKMKPLTGPLTGLLLALTNCSGWSADRIRLEIIKIAGNELEELDYVEEFEAEDIWGFHWRWVMNRGNGALCREDIEVMLCVLKEYGIILSELGIPMHKMEQPISAIFRKRWTPNTQDEGPLCRGFNTMARLQTKAYLYKNQFSYFGQFSPSEELVSDQFGSTVQRLMKNSLKEWAAAMKPIITATAPYKSLNERDAVILIMDHLRDYHHSYEKVYGYMEETTVSGKLQGSTVYIQSTGYGVKVLLGLMMADRLHVIERWRREERERVCFERVDSSDLPADCKNCSVCQDPLDTETPEGVSEQGLRLIICCQQVIGESCLKVWLAQSGPSIRKNCPNCRFDFPQCFLVKLFGEGYQMEADTEEEEYDEEDTIVVENPREVVDLVSPLPEQSLRQSPDPEEARHERSPAPSPAFRVGDLIPGENMPGVEVSPIGGVFLHLPMPGFEHLRQSRSWSPSSSGSDR